MAIMKVEAERPKTTDPIFEYMFANPIMMDYQKQNKVYLLTLEPTNKCSGSCAYCYSSSTGTDEQYIPRNKCIELINEAETLGVRQIAWAGGCPLQYPDFFKLADYATERGFDQNILTSGIISKPQAKRLTELAQGPVNIGVAIHIDTIDQEAYNRVHTNPKTLDAKIRGYNNLLEAGFPPDHVYGIITYTKPVVGTFEQTCDWFIDEMKGVWVCIVAYKTSGFAAEHRDWESSLSDLRKAAEYRARKCGEHWLKIGPTEVGCLFCNTTFMICPDGSVRPCPTLHDDKFIAGNIFQEKLVDIFEKNKDLLLYNFEVKGACGRCDHNPYCRGCRSNAYYGTGDITASDPQCYLNPEAREMVYSN